MAGSVRSKVIACLSAFVRLRSNAPDQKIAAWVRALQPLRSRASHGTAREDGNHPFVLADAKRIEVPENVRSLVPRPAIPATIAFPERAAAAGDLAPTEVYKRIAHLIDHVTEQIRSGETPYLDVPDLHSANAIYDDRGNVFLGRSVRRISLHDTMAFMRILLALEVAYELVQRGRRLMKRQLYYYCQATLPDRRSTQLDTDRALAALSNILHVRRQNLGFVAVRRGTVHGRLVIRDEGQVVDVSRLARGGWSVPGFADDVEIVESKAAFILLVEKQSVAARLAEDRWCESHPCIMICGEGFPSFSTRDFTRRLVEELRIPAYALTDGDPWGIRVALTNAHGAIATGMETPWLACEDIRWVGFYPSDYERFGLSTESEIKLSAEDIESAKLLLHHPSEAYANAQVRRELEILLDHGFKLELDSLLGHGTEFLTREYLPRKLFETDLIKL